MSLLPKQNYKYNREIPLPAGLIHGQSLGAVSGMKFGLSNMSRSGCEVIAIYNALIPVLGVMFAAMLLREPLNESDANNNFTSEQKKQIIKICKKVLDDSN